MPGAHVIETIEYDIGFRTEADAWSRHASLGDFAAGRGLVAIGEVFDEFVGDERVVRFDRLEIDLGPVPADESESDTEDRLRDALRRALERLIASDGATGPAAASVIPPNLADLDRLWGLIHLGRLPWSAARAGQDPHALVERVLAQDGGMLVRALREAPDMPRLMARIARQWSPEHLARLTRLLADTRSAQIDAMYPGDSKVSANSAQTREQGLAPVSEDPGADSQTLMGPIARQAFSAPEAEGRVSPIPADAPDSPVGIAAPGVPKVSADRIQAGEPSLSQAEGDRNAQTELAARAELATRRAFDAATAEGRVPSKSAGPLGDPVGGVDSRASEAAADRIQAWERTLIQAAAGPDADPEALMRQTARRAFNAAMAEGRVSPAAWSDMLRTDPDLVLRALATDRLHAAARARLARTLTASQWRGLLALSMASADIEILLTLTADAWSWRLDEGQTLEAISQALNEALLARISDAGPTPGDLAGAVAALVAARANLASRSIADIAAALAADWPMEGPAAKVRERLTPILAELGVAGRAEPPEIRLRSARPDDAIDEPARWPRDLTARLDRGELDDESWGTLLRAPARLAQILRERGRTAAWRSAFETRLRPIRLLQLVSLWFPTDEARLLLALTSRAAAWVGDRRVRQEDPGDAPRRWLLDEILLTSPQAPSVAAIIEGVVRRWARDDGRTPADLVQAIADDWPIEGPGSETAGSQTAGSKTTERIQAILAGLDFEIPSPEGPQRPAASAGLHESPGPVDPERGQAFAAGFDLETFVPEDPLNPAVSIGLRGAPPTVGAKTDRWADDLLARLPTDPLDDEAWRRLLDLDPGRLMRRLADLGPAGDALRRGVAARLSPERLIQALSSRLPPADARFLSALASPPRGEVAGGEIEVLTREWILEAALTLSSEALTVSFVLQAVVQRRARHEARTYAEAAGDLVQGFDIALRRQVVAILALDRDDKELDQPNTTNVIDSQILEQHASGSSPRAFPNAAPGLPGAMAPEVSGPPTGRRDVAGAGASPDPADADAPVPRRDYPAASRLGSEPAQDGDSLLEEIAQALADGPFSRAWLNLLPRELPASPQEQLAAALAPVEAGLARLANLSEFERRDLLRRLRPRDTILALETLDRLALAWRQVETRAPSARPPRRPEDVAWSFLLRELFEEDRLFEIRGFVARWFDALTTGAPDESIGVWRAGLAVELAPALAASLTRSTPTAERVAGPASIWPGLAAPEPVPGESLYVANAGLVLAGPYIPILFDRLGLTREGDFVDAAAPERAVHLLQFLVDAAGPAPEHELVLNKLVCGLDLAEPIGRDFEITPLEQETIEGLLGVMIERWSIIGSTSIAGLRESFLERQGVLRDEGEAWRMVVEPRAFDMLLDQIPWGFRTLKLAWMPQVLHVEWR